MLWHTGYLGAASPSGKILVRTWEGLEGNSHFCSPTDDGVDHQPLFTDTQTNPQSSFCTWDKLFKKGKTDNTEVGGPG